MTFPLIKLPYLALKEVIKSMSRLEMICLLKASKRANQLIKRETQLFSCDISVGLGTEKSRVWLGKTALIIYPMDKKPEKTEFLDLRLAIPMVIKDKDVDVYWDDLTDGLKMMIDLFVEAFPRVEINYDYDHEDSDNDNLDDDPQKQDYEQVYQIIEHISRKNIPLRNVIWDDSACHRSAALRLLTAFSYTRGALFYSGAIPDLDFNGFRQYSKHVTMFVPWITANHLCDMTNCHRICLYGTHLNSENLNRFLKFWNVNPGNAREVEIETSEWLDADVVMDGIRRFEIPSNEGSTQFTCRGDYCWFTVKLNGPEDFKFRVTLLIYS